MQEPFKPGLELDEDAEVRDLGDFSVDDHAGLVGFGYGLEPGVLGEMFHAQSGAMLLLVDGEHDALRAELFRAPFDQGWVAHRGTVDRHLVSPGVQHPPHVFDGADSASHRERDEHLGRYLPDNIHHRVPAVAAGGDVKEHQLIRAFPVVEGGKFRGVAGVDVVMRADARCWTGPGRMVTWPNVGETGALDIIGTGALTGQVEGEGVF